MFLFFYFFLFFIYCSFICFTLNDCLFLGVKLAKIADSDKYVYSGYGIGFDSRSEVSLPDGSTGNIVITFGIYMSSSVHTDNNGKDILILGIGPI